MIVTCAACGRKAAVSSDTKEVVCDCGHAFDPAARPTVADRFLGQEVAGYRFNEVIGSGGMGTVYRATQLSLGRPVAIKVLPEHVADDPQFVGRFHREAEVLASLSHANIIQIYDRREAHGRYFIVMEYVGGESLRELMKRGPLPPREACRIVSGLLAALDYAHERGVVHRDVKPENVLVSHAGAVKIADFGLSRVLGGDDLKSRLTRTHLVLGTYEYMAPEQREATREAGPRADIYATTVVFYEMLTGELPIGRFELPSRKVKQIDERIDAILERGLAKDPDRRYARASLMEREIESMLSAPGAPVDLAAIKGAAGRAFHRVRGVLRRKAPEVRPPSSFEMRLDLLLTILSVCGMLVTLAGIGLLIAAERIELGVVDIDDGVAGTVVLIFGAMLWNSAERARKYWPGARTTLLTLTLLAAATVVALPITIWTWVVLLGPGMRTYYASRYRGLDAADAAAVAQGMAEPPRRKSRLAPLAARITRFLFGVAVAMLIAWLFIALDDPNKSFRDEGMFFFAVGTGAGLVALLLSRSASKNL